MSSTSTWIIFILCSAYAFSFPTTELPTTRRYNLFKGHNNTRTISKLITPTHNISAVLSLQTKLNKPLKSTIERHPIKNKPTKKNNTQFTNTYQIKKVNSAKKGQIERINLVNKPKNDTLGNNFYQIKLEKTKNTKHKNSTNKNHLKQDWGDLNIPVPSPSPEISIYSPEYSIGSVPLSTEEVDSVEILPVSPENILSQFELDLNRNSSAFNSEEFDNACPNVHLSNSVLGPTKKQGCPDLNIAINTYLNQNQNPLPERIPTATNDLEAASSGIGTQVVPPPGLAASAPAAALETVANPVAAVAGDSGGGTLGGLPSLPEFPGLPKLPDLKGVLDLLRLLGKGLGFLSGALSKLSPLLYIIPLISFLLGFISILPFYPWWLPLFFFAGKNKEPPKTEVIVHKHVHKPVHHHDGWFWNHNTKTWTNIHDRVRYGRNTRDDLHTFFRINWDIHRVEQPKHSWKRRKK